MTQPVPTRTTAWVLFFSLLACYLALAPGTIEGRGYVVDDLKAGMGALASFNAWVKGRPVPPLSWTRHGPVPLLMDLPFIKVGKLFVSPDFVLSLQPVLFTAGLLTIVYLWLAKLCTPGMSLLLTLAGAFSTMLWPYAYIGLETKQSFFVLLAGYMGLVHGKIRNWRRLLLFSTICVLAITSKSTGLILAPAIAYLVFVQFRGDWRSNWKQLSVVVLIIAGIWTLSATGWGYFWEAKGGGVRALMQWTTDSPYQLFINVIGVFGSPGKGLFVFAPVLLLSLYAIPRALRSHPETTVFGLIVTACMVALLSILVVSADEIWGTRFMHVAIAPLLVIIGAANPVFQWRRHVPLLVLAAIGVSISFLGAFYYYGARGWAAEAAGQNTLEWYGGDNVWNEILFDARLFGVYIEGGTDPAPWTPVHNWAWVLPPNASPPKTVNLREYADPQSFLLYYWSRPIKSSELAIFRICLISAFLGPALLAWVVVRTVATIKMTNPRS